MKISSIRASSHQEKFFAHAKEKGMDFTRPFLALNSEYHNKDLFIFPSYILSEYNYFPTDYNFYFGTYEKAQRLFSFTPTNARLFQAGKAIVFLAGSIDLAAKRGTGGQSLTNDQKEILSALNATTFVAIERIRILREMLHPSGPNYTIATQREEIIGEITKNYWPEKDTRTVIDDRQIHLDIIFRNGQRPESWRQLYPVESLAKKNYKWAKTHFNSYSKKDLAYQILFEKSLVWSLLNCEIAEKLAVKALADMSDRVRNDKDESPQQRRLITARIHDREFADVMLVAFASNYNPANTFSNLKHRSHDFEVMANIGRIYRQLKINPDPSDINIAESNLKSIVQRLHILLRWRSAPWDAEDVHLRELMLWCFAFRMVGDYEFWMQVMMKYNVDLTSFREMESW